MLQKTSEKFKEFFLLEFTKQLIHNYAPEELFKIQKIVEKKDEEIVSSAKDENIKELVKEHENPKKKVRHMEIHPVHLKTSSQRLREGLIALKRARPVLKIPEPRLPQTMNYLRPTPTNSEIDLGKLNPFVKDPLVKVIECNGPEENIMVRGGMGTKPTKIILNKEEIEGVIKKFSEETKIPLDEGVFKAVSGTLVLSAIVSENVGSKFIIKKMAYHPNFMPQK